MLQDDFFTFTELQEQDGLTKTDIKLNAEHAIFKGHFPDQPILPGVCMMQMVKEVVQTSVKKSIRLKKGNDLKFLAFVDPTQMSLVQMELKIVPEGDLLKVDAKLLDKETVLFKFKGAFVVR